jgi:hypothetical protein
MENIKIRNVVALCKLCQISFCSETLSFANFAGTTSTCKPAKYPMSPVIYET